MTLRLVDLFAGTGAFTLAFESTGRVKCVYANDVQPHAKILYDQNHPHVSLTLADLMEIDESAIPEMDILTGGFPCQPFSIAGKRMGFEDDRSNVVWKLMRVIEHHLPKCVVLENVKNILTHDSGRTLQHIVTRLESNGYTVHYKLINTCTLTPIPQNRERVFFVCFRNHHEFEWPAPASHRAPLTDFLETNPRPKYYYSESSTVGAKLADAVTDSTVVYQYRRTHVRGNKSGVCPTLTANMGTGGHNVPIIRDKHGIRKLTPRECFNLQGFKSTYVIDGLSDTALYRLAGNAITVPVIEQIAHQVIKYLD